MQAKAKHQFYAEEVLNYKMIPTLATVLLRVSLQLTRWQQAARTRRVLKTLTDDELRDIGVSFEAAQTEAKRPFFDI